MGCLFSVVTREAEMYELQVPVFSRALQVIPSNLINATGYVSDPLLSLLFKNNPLLSQMEV